MVSVCEKQFWMTPMRTDQCAPTITQAFWGLFQPTGFHTTSVACAFNNVSISGGSKRVVADKTPIVQ